MKNPCKQALMTASLSLAVMLPNFVSAESSVDFGAGPLSTDARVDFRITIPNVLRFQVGTAGGTIDLIDIAPSAAALGNGTDVAATGGDQGGGQVSVNVLSNAGQVTIGHDTNGASMNDGGGNNIPYTEILTASNNTANLDAPALGGSSSTTPSLTGNLTVQSATWTYTYDNTALYNSGTYGGAGVNGGRVTYTASTP